MTNKNDTGKMLAVIAYLPQADASVDCKGITGFDRADCNVHENTPGGFGGDQDVRTL